MWTRRFFLQSSAAASLALGFNPTLSLCAGADGRRFVLVILRGAMDGLAAAPPLGDPWYRKARQAMALDKEDTLPLDGFFNLHKAFSFLHGEYRAGGLSVFQAVATPYRERSHFDGQDVLENGAVTALGSDTGWLGRTIAAAGDPQKGLAISQAMPMVLWGTNNASTWSPSVMPEAPDGFLQRLGYLYEDDPEIEMAFQNALAADAIAPDMSGGGIRRGLQREFGTLTEAAAAFLKADDGPTCAVLEVGGWDTHANQGLQNGPLADNFRMLDEGLRTLKTSLGDTWDKTVVFVATEFGRTVAANGSGGTDHGTASAAFLLGGTVNGGRVTADWPGLNKTALYEGRDLMPTLDMRSIIKGVLHDFMEVPNAKLDGTIFPDSAGIKSLQGLIKA